MLRTYFYVSYTSSFVGYQFSWIPMGGEKLEFLTKDVPVSPLTLSVLKNGGAKCIAGRLEKGSYFVLRGLEAVGPDGKIWYVNLAMEADDRDRETFRRGVHKMLVEHTAFVEKLGSWFSPSEGSLSYRIDAGSFHAFLGDPRCPGLEDPYYQKKNGYVCCLGYFLGDLKKGLTHRIHFLVPERTRDNFHSKNPVFEKRYAAYTMPQAQFDQLLNRRRELYTMQQPMLPWKYIPMPDAKTLETMKKGAKIAGAVSVLAAVYCVVDAMFEEDAS